MHVDEINQVVHLIEKSKTEVREELQSQLDEVKEGLTVAQNASKTLAALWALTTLFAIVAVLILAING
jgi:predicted DNA-binding ArsR family transcriptional regulator